jgi:hypothetical protein
VRIRLYFDEDSARHSLVRELRFRGADLVTAMEAGMAGRADGEQLEWAASNGRALYSFNRSDFHCLHTTWLREGRNHSGIILSRQGLSVGEQMRRLLRLIAARSADEMQNHVEFLSKG